MSARMDVSGFIRDCGDAKPRVLEAVRRAMDIAGEQVIGHSQQLCPVLTGALQASATTEPAKIEGDLVTKLIGHDTDYAAAVHENPTAHHDQGQWKFLETSMRNDNEKVMTFVADKAKEAL